MSILFTFRSDSPTWGGGEGIYDTELKQEKGKLEPKITTEENKSVCKNVYTKVFIYMMIYQEVCVLIIYYIATLSQLS